METIETGRIGTLLGLVVIMSFAFVLARLTTLKNFLPRPVQEFFYSYIEFLFLGMFIGKSGLNLVSQRFIRQLDPFLLVGLGWIGLYYGMQFDLKKVKMFSARLYGLAFFQSIFTFLVMVVVFAPVLIFIEPLGERWIPAALFVATIGAISAPLVLNRFLDNLSSLPRPIVDLVQFTSSVDGIVSVTIFGIISIALYPHQAIFPVLGYMGNIFLWFILSCILAIIMAYVFSALLIGRPTNKELFLYIIGILILSSAIAHYLRFSVVFVNFVFGLWLANITWQRETLVKLLAKVETPFYILLLLLAGAYLEFSVGPLFWLIPLYLLLHIAGKAYGLKTAMYIFNPGQSVPLRLGMSLTLQGALAVTLLINAALLCPEYYVGLLVNFLLLSVIINDFVAPLIIRRALRTED
ncbi:hypothetical protein J7M23_09340 [Candidatus Sumerlaeota bacterium]|nr:hypothetical protein [Candidatus Sumerlaeota bacterium]